MSDPKIPLEIREADLSDPEHATALVEIIDSYAGGPGGQNAPLEPEAREAMARGVREHPSMFALLAFSGDKAVGVAVCLWPIVTLLPKVTFRCNGFEIYWANLFTAFSPTLPGLVFGANVCQPVRMSVIELAICDCVGSV